MFEINCWKQKTEKILDIFFGLTEINMGEAPAREDGTVTRSAEVTSEIRFILLYLFIYFLSALVSFLVVCFAWSYVFYSQVCGLISCGWLLFGRPDGATPHTAEVP